VGLALTSQDGTPACRCSDPAVFGHIDGCELIPPVPDCSCNHRPYPETEWHADRDGLERSLNFWPGFLCTLETTDPGYHGRHGMQLTWALRGPAGAATFIIWTDWVPGAKSSPQIAEIFPMATDVGWHSPRWRKGWFLHRCPFLRPCWYNGSPDAAVATLESFKTDGEAAVWNALRTAYNERLVAEG